MTDVKEGLRGPVTSPALGRGMNQQTITRSAPRFFALDVAIEIVRALRDVVEMIGRRDTRLAQQVRDAASSIPLNVAEGNRRRGKDRRYHFSVAAGSADELCSIVQPHPVYEVATSDGMEALSRELAGIPEVAHVKTNGAAVTFVYQGAPESAPEVLKRLMARNIAVTSFARREVSLEEVFLAVTKGGVV